MLKDITISYRANPIGLDEPPAFSWKIVSGEENTFQAACQIVVAGPDGVVWDSGVVSTSQSVLVPYAGAELAPMTAYDVEVSVWDNHGETHRGAARFETGLLSRENWRGEWITHSFPATEAACPVFFKTVTPAKAVRSARVYATACGVYELAVNGYKAGDAFLAPGWTSYQNRLQYQTYDITGLISGTDEIKLELTVGNGWYKGYLNGEGEKEFYGDRAAVLAMLRLEYEDGMVDYVGTGPSWQVTTGPIQSAELYHGETQDFTAKPRTPTPAVSFDPAGQVGQLTAQESEPIRVTKRIPAQRVFRTPKGEAVVDFGQNMAGLVELRLPPLRPGEAARTVTLRHGEALDSDGNFYAGNLRTARATDSYTYGPDMAERTVMPRFTYHGFRYICVEGMDGDMEPGRFTACAMHTDMEQIGTFSCDNQLVNRLQSNIQWGQRSNFFDIPTDCPQRDERLGWTGDAQIFCATGCYNFNAALFFRKWLRDVAAESDMTHGVPHLVPNIVGPSVGTAVWGDCATVIPWQLYLSYGDTQALAEQYPLMKLWVDYIKAQCGDSVLWLNGFQRGDWLALDAPASRPGLMSGGTDKNLVANCCYALSTRIVRDAAKALGKTADEAEYARRYETIVSALNDEYVTRTGRVVTETQTACALLLHFGLLREERQGRVLKALEENLTGHKNHLTTGFVGTAYLCHALSEQGRHELAAEVFLQPDYPGWFYAIGKGATTIWERWNSILPNGDFDQSGMNSLNHYSYGSIGDWMYQKIGGIRPEEPGYKKIRFQPTLTRSMTQASASLETMYGRAACAWTCRDGKLTVEVEVPVNTTAVLVLPERDGEIPLGSGTYRYEYPTGTCLDAGAFSKSSTFAELLADERAAQVLYEVMPDLRDSPMLGFIKSKTIGEMEALSTDSAPMLTELLKRLNTL